MIYNNSLTFIDPLPTLGFAFLYLLTHPVHIINYEVGSISFMQQKRNLRYKENIALPRLHCF